MAIVNKFARVKLGTDFDKINAEDREVLKRLIRAAAFLNPVYLRQVSQFNPQFKQEIEDTRNKQLIESFLLMGGPWDRFEGDKPFYGSISKPLGAGFYPVDITREEFETWIAEHPEDKEAFLSFTTLIRRREGRLVARPFSEVYALELNKAHDLLKEAADLTSNVSLKSYLNSRAEALLSNDYVDSDGAWIGLDSDIELVFGPYETYEDQLFGYKATFEAFVGYRNADETRRLEHIASLVEEMQAALPITDEMKNSRGEQSSSPFVVIDLLSTAGEARIGIQTLAFVLPNDPVVVQKYGTKKVMMKNVQEAKFNAILKPIAERFLTPDALNKISFEAFFRHTILHETGHSLGPKAVKDSEASIIHHLADVYAPIEECKADSTSNFISHWLYKRGELTMADMESTYATMVAGFFRSLRFGLNQAHARANAIQLNFLLEHGAVTCDIDGKFDFVMEKMPEVVKQLVQTVMDLEYAGDREAARAFLDKYAVLSEDLMARLTALSDLPIDILCEYEAERALV